MTENEFKINNYLSLKLEQGETNIYVNKIKFDQCKNLMLNIPKEKEHQELGVLSIDKIAEYFYSTDIFSCNINPETEFWAYCSNLQAWAENNYDTRLLHSHMAIPLLKKLTEAGDPRAKQIFAEEITKRFVGGNSNIRRFMRDEGFFVYLTADEMVKIFEFCPTNWRDELIYILIKIRNDIYGAKRLLDLWLQNEKDLDNQSLIVIGNFLEEIKEISKAIEMYEKYLERYPENRKDLTVMLNLAFLYDRNAKFRFEGSPKADKIFHEMFELDFKEAFKIIFEKGPYDRSWLVLKKKIHHLISENKEVEIIIHLIKGINYLNAFDFYHVISNAYRKLMLKLDNNTILGYGRMLHVAGIRRLQIGDYEGAIELLKLAVESGCMNACDDLTEAEEGKKNRDKMVF